MPSQLKQLLDEKLAAGTPWSQKEAATELLANAVANKTVTAAQISDATTAGRAMLTAADAEAQAALLGVLPVGTTAGTVAAGDQGVDVKFAIGPDQSSVVVSGAGNSFVNGTYFRDGDANGKPRYRLGQTNLTIQWASLGTFRWVIDVGGAVNYFDSASNAVSYPWQVPPGDWSQFGEGEAPAPTVTESPAEISEAGRDLVIAPTHAAQRELLGAMPAVGVTDGSNAAAGMVGEVITGTSANAVDAVEATPVTIASVALTAGDWDVYAAAHYQDYGDGTSSGVRIGLNTSATLAGLPRYKVFELYAVGASVTSSIGGPVPVSRVNVTSTTTIYLVGLAEGVSEGCDFLGEIIARRVR